jgi:hypothetical protein
MEKEKLNRYSKEFKEHKEQILKLSIPAIGLSVYVIYCLIIHCKRIGVHLLPSSSQTFR